VVGEAGVEGQQIRHGNRSIGPGVPRPSTVLVTEMGTGAFLVQGYPTGAAAYVSAAEGGPLREALDAAFGDGGVPMDAPPRVRPRV
jgi:hypothetical protein